MLNNHSHLQSVACIAAAVFLAKVHVVINFLLSQSRIHICCGCIIGMGETLKDRADFLWQLTQLDKMPERSATVATSWYGGGASAS